MANLTLGSLFDGSGGFPLAGLQNDITPIWASEVEPFPIRVTTKRIPQMQHVGDITRLNGATLPPVDIITFGSPCTDLSVAGRREGLHGEQSSLFFHAVRIIQEMRRATNGKQPRFIVWENVPGALTSTNGADFRAVLGEIVKIKSEQFTIPMPTAGQWMCAGECVADDFSVVWRVIDAQYFGIPQRRRRVYLVADFASERAADVLFECDGVSRDIASCQGEGQNPSANAMGGVEETSGFVMLDVNLQDTRLKIAEDDKCQTLCAQMGTGGNNVPLCLQGAMIGRTPKKSDRHGVVYALDRAAYNQGKNAQFDISIQADGTAQTVLAKGPGAVAAELNEYAVRRLTPLECCRLQGFPDDWCAELETPKPTKAEIYKWSSIFATHKRVSGKPCASMNFKQVRKWLKNPHSDAAEYKMWGNGIALPCAVYVMKGIVDLCRN